LGSSDSLDVSQGDVDGDGDLDAFVANFGANKVWLNVAPPLAETSIIQGLSSNATDVIVVKVNIDRIKDPSDNSTANISGGIGSYTATVSSNASSIIQFVTVYGISPFDGPSFNATSGVFSVAVVSSPPQVTNTTVAEVVSILTGNVTTSVNLTTSFNIIGAALAAQSLEIVA
tara:strand:+ start:7 stop:525 length:519 start_codon:yes stop_codon:yes gene_type:complete